MNNIKAYFEEGVGDACGTIYMVLGTLGFIATIVLWVDSSSLGLRESAVAITYFANSFFALSEFVL